MQTIWGVCVTAEMFRTLEHLDILNILDILWLHPLGSLKLFPIYKLK